MKLNNAQLPNEGPLRVSICYVLSHMTYGRAKWKHMTKDKHHITSHSSKMFVLFLSVNKHYIHYDILCLHLINILLRLFIY